MSEIDARGLKCPWPALRLARALRAAPAGPLVVLADDPAAERELAAVAAAAERAFEKIAPGEFRIESGR